MVANLRVDAAAIRTAASGVGTAASVLRPERSLTSVNEAAIASAAVAGELARSSELRATVSEATADILQSLGASAANTADQFESVDAQLAKSAVG